MFSLATTMFYMLSAYIAFLIGSSNELNVYLMLIVPVGFVAGYMLDRLNSVKKLWVEDRSKIYKTIIFRYAFFLAVSAIFFAVGLAYASKFWE